VVAPINWNFISCRNHVSWPVMMVFTLSCCASWPFRPWTPLLSTITILEGYICVPHWCWVESHITWNFIGCKNAVSGLVKMVFTLSCSATWPFPPWNHLNSFITILERLYLCSTLVLGGSTHARARARARATLLVVETMCLGRSWWFSPCPVVLLGPFLHGPTLIRLF
jgi:hypothetical protein